MLYCLQYILKFIKWLSDVVLLSTRINKLNLTHPIDAWQHHPYLEQYDGFRISVNQFWTNWTRPRTSSILNGLPRTHKVVSGMNRFELNIPRKNMNKNLTVELRRMIIDAILPSIYLEVHKVIIWCRIAFYKNQQTQSHSSDRRLATSSLPRTVWRIQNFCKPILDQLDQTTNFLNSKRTTSNTQSCIWNEPLRTQYPQKDRKKNLTVELRRMIIDGYCLQYILKFIKWLFDVELLSIRIKKIILIHSKDAWQHHPYLE